MATWPDGVLLGMVTAMGTFVALDFELADRRRDSACAVALVRVEGRRIVDRTMRLIRPPRERFTFTGVHGIAWAQVETAPSFAQVWASLAPLLTGADFIAAHNVAFDRSVLHACCLRAQLRPPNLRFSCTMRLARQRWGLYPTRLPDVCRHLGLSLRHHDPLSDAEACARIVLAAAD